MDKIYLNDENFRCVGVVAKHCDNEKLCIATLEAQDFDMAKALCEIWHPLSVIIEEVLDYEKAVEDAAAQEPPGEPPSEPVNYQKKKDLLYGAVFASCDGSDKKHLGVIRVLTCYAYSRYVLINGFSDTASGAVTKTNTFSIPKTVKELEVMSNKYRSMGFEALSGVRQFICKNKDVFTTLEKLPCDDCGCDKGCGGDPAFTKGHGIRSTTISKYSR